MDLIKKIFGSGVKEVAGAATDVAEVFRVNSEKSDARNQERFKSVQEAYSKEDAGEGWFNNFVNGLNRLPRPLMAFSTIGLFAFAFVNPASFSIVMSALDLVPHEMWWMLGAIVSFYFGARELSYHRKAKSVEKVVKEIEMKKEVFKDFLTPMSSFDDDPDVHMDIVNNPDLMVDIEK